MWYRVFGQSDEMPQPAELQERLRDAGLDVPLAVKGDDLGWTSIDLPLARLLKVERYLTNEDDLRDELDSWAAVAESWGAFGPLLERIVSTRQLFTLRSPDESMTAECDLIVAFLAERTGGFIHADGRGFIAPDGAVLLAES